MKDGTDLAVVTLGPVGNVAEKAIARAEKATSCSVAHYDLRFLKPLDEDMLHEIGKTFARILTIEDGVLKGGMGSAVLEFMSDHGYTPEVKRLGIPDCFVQHGAVQELHAICGIDETNIYRTIIQLLDK